MLLHGKQSRKRYLVFTSVGYQIVVYALLPLGLVGIAVWGGINIGDIGLMLMMMLLPLAEILSDSWLFGGIQARDAEKMDYLKTSHRGMAVLQSALRGDLVRKFLMVSGTIVISYLIIRQTKGSLSVTHSPGAEGAEWTNFIGRSGAGQEMGILLYLIFLSYLLSVLGTMLSRFGSTIYWNMLIGYGAMVLGILGLFAPGLLFYRSVYLWLLDVVCACLGIAVSILAVRVAMRKVEGGYYDQ